MLTENQLHRRTLAAAELREHGPDVDSRHTVDSLSVGLTLLRDLLMTRVHQDVEQYYGMDSMMAPVSSLDEQRQIQVAKIEIEVYSAVVASDEVAQQGYVDPPSDWFLEWLFRLRLGDRHNPFAQRRHGSYGSQSIEQRRLKFVSVLQRAVPEASKAPLVLYRLFPRAVRIATAVAFGDPLRAQELRAEQCKFLPALCDCHECHGRVVDNEEVCRGCGNPVWQFGWLVAD